MRAVIFANGILADPQVARAAIRPDDVLIAADGGAQNCLSLGLQPTVIVGDLDSVSSELLERLQAQGSRSLAYPQDKDQTDLELALRFAIQEGAEEILLLGLLGGRLDQTLANLLLLALPDWGNVHLVVMDGPDTAHFLRGGDTVRIEGQPGDIVSLIPLSPAVSGVTTQALHWPLNAATLEFGSTLGISNEMTEPSARVQLQSGHLLVVHRKASLPEEKE